MVRKQCIVILLSIASYSYGAEFPEKIKSSFSRLIFGQPPQFFKELYKGTYLEPMPKELITLLIPYALNVEIRHSIEHSKTIEQAINNIKGLTKVKEYDQYFKDPSFIDALIYALAIRFPQVLQYRASMGWSRTYRGMQAIADKLNTEGAKRWLREISPQQEELMYVIKSGDFKELKELISEPITQVNLDHALRNAIAKKRIDMIQYLLDHGADVNVPRILSKNLTPLMTAVMINSPAIVKLLLEKGANPYVSVTLPTSAKGIEFKGNALDMAQAYGFNEVAAILRKAMTEQKR